MWTLEQSEHALRRARIRDRVEDVVGHVHAALDHVNRFPAARDRIGNRFRPLDDDLIRVLANRFANPFDQRILFAADGSHRMRGR
jgi:hypothetical protein